MTTRLARLTVLPVAAIGLLPLLSTSQLLRTVNLSLPQPTAAAHVRVEEAFGKLPLYFVENQGQVDDEVAYYIQGSDKTIYFTSTGVTFALTTPVSDTVPTDSVLRSGGLAPASFRRSEEGEPTTIQRWAAKLDFVGADPVRPVGVDQTEAVISYFRGPREQWKAGLPTYSRIVYHDLWPGIDLAYYGTVDRIKYEYIVHPGADPAQIRLAYSGVSDVRLNGAGQLEVSTPLGGFADDTPVAYQEIDGQRISVSAAYALYGSTEYGVRSTEYGFRVGPYDPARPLVLDPAVIVYCGYIGGSGDDHGYGIAVDRGGNTYVMGYTDSTEATFPVAVGPDLTHNGYSDVFVAKLNAEGTGLGYCSYIGGDDEEAGWGGIAVDAVGNAYITGQTWSTEATFPVIVGPDLTHNGGLDAFVAKVDRTGTGLTYCGYIGGDDLDQGQDIALDSARNAYVTGGTGSTEATFPVLGGPDLTHNGGDWDAFVAKVHTTGARLTYCGYIGGDDWDRGEGIAVDGATYAYIAGVTYSDEDSFPVSVGPDLSKDDGSDAFVAKVNREGTGLDYCGYIGGDEGDRGHGIAVDWTGNAAYITGGTYSTEDTFPVLGGPDLTYNGEQDAFVAKVNAAGTGLTYCGYIGGDDWDYGSDIAVDGAENAYIIGSTGSTETTFHPLGGPDLTHNGKADAFAARVNRVGTELDYCGYIGGDGLDSGSGIAVDGAGNAYVIGSTESAEATFPTVGGPDLTFNGGSDAFVAKVQDVDLSHWTYLPMVLYSR